MQTEKDIKPVIRQVFLAARNRGLARREEEVTNDRTERANRRFRRDFYILVLMLRSIRRLNKNVPAYMGVLSSASPSNWWLDMNFFFSFPGSQVPRFPGSQVPRFPGSQVLVSFFYLSCLHVKLFTCILQAKKNRCWRIGLTGIF